MTKKVWDGELLERADVTKRDGYPCDGCYKDGLVSCQWRKCRDFQPFYRSAWPAITAPLTPRRKR